MVNRRATRRSDPSAIQPSPISHNSTIKGNVTLAFASCNANYQRFCPSTTGWRFVQPGHILGVTLIWVALVWRFMDRRKHHRVQLRLPARLRWTTPFGQKTEVCETVNVSRGGLLVPCQEVHAEGMPLWVTFP